ncbi:hypothetical protein ACRS3T_24700 [Burkholderia cenocepacia]
MLMERLRGGRAGFARNIARALNVAGFYSSKTNNMHRFAPIDAGSAFCAPAAVGGRPTVLPGARRAVSGRLAARS